MVEADLRGWLPVMGVILPEDQIADVLTASDEALIQCVTAVAIRRRGSECRRSGLRMLPGSDHRSRCALPDQEGVHPGIMLPGD